MTDESSCVDACVQVHVVDEHNIMTTSIWWISPENVDEVSALITEHVGALPECAILDGNEVMVESKTIWDKSIQLATE